MLPSYGTLLLGNQIGKSPVGKKELFIMTDEQGENSSAPLPSGWKKRESKSNPGKYYYISPNGQTQWTRPFEKSVLTRMYNWAHEVEIEFGPGRLGVQLRQIRMNDPAPVYPQFLAEVEQLPKLSNGKAGPAEIYNWSVKQEKRLTPGMRLVTIDGTTVAGFTYNEVVQYLKKQPRPMKVRFADVSIGTVEDQEKKKQEESGQDDSSDSDGKSSLSNGTKSGSISSLQLQKQLFSEYQELLIAEELRKEYLCSNNLKLLEKNRELSKRLRVIQNYYDELSGKYEENSEEKRNLIESEQHFKKMKADLHLQEEGKINSKEMELTEKLMTLNSEYITDIEELSKSNKKLKKQRESLSKTLEKMDVRDFGDEFVEESNSNANENSIATDLSVALEKLSALEEEIKREEEKASSVQKEINRLSQQYSQLEVTEKRQEEMVEGDKSPAVVRLETKIDQVRAKMHDVVQSMAQAARAGDKFKTEEYGKERVYYKKELKNLQDELRRLKDCEEVEGRSRLSSRSGGAKQDSNPNPPRVRRSSNALSVASSSSKELTLPKFSGYLYKCPTVTADQSGLMRNMKSLRRMKERYCELNGTGSLLYYKRKGDSAPRGKFSLSDETLEIVSEHPSSPSFVLSTNIEQVRFVAKNNEELAEWMKCLRDTISVIHHQRGKANTSASQHQPPETPSSTSSSADDYGRATLGF